jgi:hypothetical protein
MTITFACKSCGARFTVADRLAGKKARCKGCGRTMMIPAQSQSAVTASSSPALAGAAVGPGARPLNWLDAVTSQVALKPITMEQMSVLRKPKERSPYEDDGPAGPYAMASMPSLPAVERATGRPAGALTRGYRNALLEVQRLFRRLNEWAFLASAPFLFILIMAILLRNHTWAALGATGVVLLNVGRLAAGLANLVVIPFRDSPVQGVMFLIPPLTFVYIAQNWARVRKPVERVIGPILWVGLVVLAFAFVPFLRNSKADASVAERLKGGAESLQGEMKGQLDRAGVDRIEKSAREALDKAKDQVEKSGVLPTGETSK